MKGKLVSTKGRLADKEFEIDPARGIAFEAPGGKRVEIRFQKDRNIFTLASPGYPVSVNAEPKEEATLADGDVLGVGANEFRFVCPDQKREDLNLTVESEADGSDTERGMPAITDDKMDMSATVQVSAVEFCDVCSVPVTDLDFKSGGARRVGSSILCLECFEKANDAAPPVPRVKPAVEAPPGPRRPSSRLSGRRGRGGRPAPAPSPRSAPPAKPGSSRLKAAGSPARTKPPAPGTEALEPVDVKPVVKPAAGRRPGSAKAPGTEALETAEAKPSVRPASRPAAAVRKKERPPVKGSGSGTDELEPVAPAPVSPARPRAVRAPAPAAKAQPQSVRAPKAERAVPKGPGLGSRLVKMCGLIFRKIGGAVAFLVRLVWRGVRAFGGALRRMLKRRSLARKLRAAYMDMGREVHANAANIAVVTDGLLEKAADVRAMDAAGESDPQRRTTAMAELGAMFYAEYFERSPERSLTRSLTAAEEIRNNLDSLKTGTAPEAPARSSRRARRADAPSTAEKESEATGSAPDTGASPADANPEPGVPAESPEIEAVPETSGTVDNPAASAETPDPAVSTDND